MRKIFILLLFPMVTVFGQQCYHNEVDDQFIIVSSDSLNYYYKAGNYGQYGTAQFLSNKRLITENDLMYKIDGNYVILSKFGIPPTRISKLLKRDCLESEKELFQVFFVESK